jgi:hypothetical protein
LVLGTFVADFSVQFNHAILKSRESHGLRGGKVGRFGGVFGKVEHFKSLKLGLLDGP